MSKLQKHKIKKNLYLKKKKIQISQNFQNTHNLKNTVNCHKKYQFKNQNLNQLIFKKKIETQNLKKSHNFQK